MTTREASQGWLSASTLAAAGTTAGAVWWLGLLASRFLGVTHLSDDRAMSRLFLAGAVALALAAAPGVALAVARLRGSVAQRVFLAVAAITTVAYLFRLSAGHVPLMDADYRGSSDTDILLVAVGWTFIAWQLWRLRQQA